MADVSQDQSPKGSTSQKLRSYLEADGFQAVLQKTIAKGADPDRLARLAIQVVQRGDDKLQACSILSIADCVLMAAELGLEISSSVLGQAFLVPFKRKIENGGKTEYVWEAKLIPSYKGKAELARRSGLIQRIEARVIHANDYYRPRAGTSPRLVHRWKIGERGAAIGYYAVAFFKDGPPQFDEMSVEDVQRVRNKAPSKDSPAWLNHFDEMAKKTVLHRLEKHLPLSPAQERAHDLDEEEGDIVPGKVVPFTQAPAAALPESEIEPKSKPPRSRALAAAQEKAQQIELPNREGVLVGGVLAPKPDAGTVVTHKKPAEYVDPGPCVLTEGCVKVAGHSAPCAPAAPPPPAPPAPGIPSGLFACCGGRDGNHKPSCKATAAPSAKPTGKDAAAEPRMREPGED